MHKQNFHHTYHTFFWLILLLCLLPVQQATAQFDLIDRAPEPYSNLASPSGPIMMEFNQDIDPTTLQDGISVFGSVSGRVSGDLSLEAPNRIIFSPSYGFTGGERITVIITANLESDTGIPFDNPVQWSFHVRPELGSDQFSEREELDLREGSEPAGILSADLNNNLLPDIVAVNSNNTLISILENRHHISGNFVVAREIETGIDPQPKVAEPESMQRTANLPVHSGIASADLNNNGFTDVVVAATLSNQLIILRNSADGTTNMDVELIDTGERPVQVIAADMTNNGNPDLVVASAGTDRILIHPNDGNGNFTAPLALNTGLAPLLMTVEDFSSNGYPDILVALSGENRVIGFLNQGNGTYNETTLISDLSFTPSLMTSGNYLESISSGEVPDLVLGSTDESVLYLYRHNGSDYQLYETLTNDTLSRPVSGILSDLTANGAPDLISAHHTSGDLLLNLNSGSAGFINQTILEDIEGPVGIHSADLNFSGSLDLAVTNLTTGQVTILYNDARRPSCLFSLGHNFGEICLGEISETLIPIENICPYPLEVNVSVIGDGFETDINSFEIEPGEVFNLPVRFQPTERTNYEGAIRAEYVRQGSVFSEVVVFPLEGRGVIGELTVPNELTFGEIEVHTSETRQLVIQNTGDVEQSIDLDIENTDSVFEIAGAASFTLAAGGQRSISIAFNPDEVGTFTDELIVSSSSDCGDEQYQVQLTGTAVEPVPPLPDLVADRLEPLLFDEDFLFGETYSFEAVFRLDGEVDITDPFDVSFSVNNEEVSRTRITESLQPGDSRAFQLQYTFTQLGAHQLLFTVDTENEIEESDLTNNQVSLTIDIEQGPLSVTPNPFTPNNDGYNDQVEFDFSRVGGNLSPVVRIFSFNGKLVRTLRNINGDLISWDGLDDNGSRLYPGVYLYVVENNNQLIARGSVTLAL